MSNSESLAEHVTHSKMLNDLMSLGICTKSMHFGKEPKVFWSRITVPFNTLGSVDLEVFVILSMAVLAMEEANT